MNTEEAWITPTEARRMAADFGDEATPDAIRRARDAGAFRWRADSRGSYEIGLTHFKAWLFDRWRAREEGR